MTSNVVDPIFATPKVASREPNALWGAAETTGNSFKTAVNSDGLRLSNLEHITRSKLFFM